MNRSYQITPRDPVLGGGWNLALFEDGQPAGAGVFPIPQEDPEIGVTWWNSMTEQTRAYWLAIAASAVPADAWHAFRRSQAYEDAQAQGDDWMGIDG